MNLVDTLGERLVAAIAAQDEAAIAACFAEDAEFRALSPPGLRERSAGADVGALIAMWFGDSTVLEVAETQTMQIGDRLRISYRFTGIENDEPFVRSEVIDGRPEQRIPEGKDPVGHGVRPGEETKAAATRRADDHDCPTVADQRAAEGLGRLKRDQAGPVHRGDVRSEVAEPLTRGRDHRQVS
jgi:hypothetical protein